MGYSSTVDICDRPDRAHPLEADVRSAPTYSRAGTDGREGQQENSAEPPHPARKTLSAEKRF